MEEALSPLAHLCRASGLDAWEIFGLDRRASRLTLEGEGTLDRQLLHDRGVGLRVGRGDRRVFGSTSDLTSEGLRRFLDRLVSLLPQAPPGDALRLPAPGGDDAPPSLEDPPQPSPEEVQRLLRESASGVAAGGTARSHRSRYRWSRSSVRVLNSLGLDAAFRHSRFTVAAQAECEGSEGPASVSRACFVSHPDLLEPRRVGREASRMAADLARAVRPPRTTCALVLSPVACASLLTLLSPALCGTGDPQGEPPFRGLLGESVGSAALTLTDDPHDPRGFGSTPFDGEGATTRRQTFVHRGILQGFAQDASSAARQGLPPTGHAVRNDYAAPPAIGFHNLHVEAAHTSAEDLLASADDGIYLQELWPGEEGFKGEGPALLGWGYALRGGERGEPLAGIRIGEPPGRLLYRLADAARDHASFPGGVMGSTLLFDAAEVYPDGGRSR